jgi:hypothetical protein
MHADIFKDVIAISEVEAQPLTALICQAVQLLFGLARISKFRRWVEPV